MKAFLFQTLHRLAQQLRVSLDHLRADLPAVALPVVVLAYVLGQIEDDGCGQVVIALGHGEELLARLGLEVGRIDDGEPPAGQPFLRGQV